MAHPIDRPPQPFGEITEALPYPVAAVERDGRICTGNRAWLRLFGANGGFDQRARRLGEMFPDAAAAADEARQGGGTVSRRALPLSCGPFGAATWWDIDLVPHPDVADVVLVTAHDVTELVLTRREYEDAREALEPVDSRLRLAQEVAGIGTWEWDAKADRQSWSPQQFRIHGLDPAVAVPPSYDEWCAMVHPQDRPRIQSALELGFEEATGDAFQVEFRICRVDSGVTRWLLSMGRVMDKAPDGRLRRVLGVNIDITERRNEREALRESEALLRLASEAAGVYAWEWDVGSGRVRWAEGLEAALGLPPGGFGGTVDAFRALVHPDDAALVEASLRRALDGETAGYRATFRMVRANGGIRWTETRGVVLRDAGGRSVRIVGLDHDRTDQKVFEAALQARAAQQAAIARLGQFALRTPSALAVMQEATRILAGILEIDAAQVVGRGGVNGALEVRAGFGSWDDAAQDQMPPAPEPAIAGAALLPTSMSVVIRSSDSGGETYGVLRVRGRAAGSFSTHDASCVEAVANIIAAAVQRERAEAALLERKAHLREFIEHAPAAIAMLDADMRYLAVSRRFVTEHGLPFGSPAELEGRMHYEIFPNLSANWCEMHHQAFVGKSCRADEDLLEYPDGRMETARWEMTPWHRADGTVGGALLFTEVITERKEVEAALADSEARFGAVVDAIPQLVFVTSEDGVSEYSNRRWFDYSGQAPGQGGDGWLAALHPDDREATIAAWDLAVATGRSYEQGHRLRAKDGQYRWFLSRATPWRAADDGRGMRWLGTATDISDIVQARERAESGAAILETQVVDRTQSLTEAAAELQAEMRRRQEMQSALMQSQKLEALGQLTAGVAHDFNNVLTAIHGSFEMIERRTADARLLQIATLGKSATDRAVALTRQLLDFGRSEPLAPVELDVETAIWRASELIGHALGPGVSREVDVAPGVWPVLTDGHQLEVALLNLAVNARDAMPHGGKLILAARNLTPCELPDGLTRKDYVGISAQDNGQGMPADVLARATEPFFTTKAEGKGTGLGLPMVHSFARRSGGCVRITSREGVGTTVQIILPRASVTDMERDDPEPDSTAEDVSDGRPAPVLRATILVVEDDDQVRQIAMRYLRDLGYDVVDAPNAEAAIVLSHSIERLDLLLTDVALPGVSGAVLAQRLRAQRPQLPVLFITGFGARADLQSERVLLKPFTGPDLAQAISRALGRMGDAESAGGGLLRRLKNPALVAAYLFWNGARNGGKPPRMTELDWGGVPDAEHAFTVAVERAGDTMAFRYLRVGRGLSARLGRSLEGTTAFAPDDAEPNDDMFGSLAGAYRRCARALTPSYDYARYDFGDGSPVSFERLVLPVSDDGQQVTHLVGLALFSGDTHGAHD